MRYCFLGEKDNTVLGIGSYTTKAWRAWGMCGVLRIPCVFEGGRVQGGKQGYYNSLGEDLKRGWSRGN